MTHVYCLGHRLGRPGDGELAAQGLSGLVGRLRDADAGGWFTSLDATGQSPDEKACYTHAFVVLAASSARMTELPGADDLLEESLALWQERFFDPAAGLFVDAWDRGFDRRGCLPRGEQQHALRRGAAGRGRRDRGRRAPRAGAGHRPAGGPGLRPAAALADPGAFRPGLAAASWTTTSTCPTIPFQPYGATVGHGLEWSRLLLHLEASLGDQAPEWLLRSSVALFDRAAADGWAVDGADGFIYTTDWDGRPVVRDRMHWVLAEGFAAAAALHQRTGEERYADLARTWWAYAERCLIDREHGSWHHQLDAENQVIATVWPGKPDLYHAVQATLLPRLPLRLSLAAALAAGPPAADRDARATAESDRGRGLTRPAQYWRLRGAIRRAC